MSEENYSLMDSGNGRRLEKIGEILIDRPAPQADYAPALPRSNWEEASLRFIRSEKEIRWEIRQALPEPLYFMQTGLTLELRLSPKGQLGIYPEQKVNWLWLKQLMEHNEDLRVLNGFAYTGASTLAAAYNASESSEIVHIDAAKSAVNWAKKNLEASGLEERNVRFIVEDMQKFLERETRRERCYQGIILDPPAFGRAPGGKTWKIQRDLPGLIKSCSPLMRENPCFFLLSCHEQSITKTILRDYLTLLPGIEKNRVELLDLTIPSQTGNPLPNGIAARWSWT